MFKTIQTFLKSEDGAITVDWVVLTAAIVGLTGASAGLINSGIVSASGHIGDAVQEQETNRWN